MNTRKPGRKRIGSAKKSVAQPSLVRTNIVLDRDLVERVKQRTGASTAREAVQKALEQAAGRFTLDDLHALRDLNPLRPHYDPKDPMAEERAARSAVAEPAADYLATSSKPPKRRRS